MSSPQHRSDAPVTPTRVSIASMIGTIMEWYDFFLYGFVAALVFGQLFFPTYSSVSGTLAAFATLAVGFVARPLGGVVFGHFGDKIGRKAMLITSLSIMGGATFAIGLLPTYQQIGIWAPILLTVCRFLQGIALGGEWGGAVLMAVEYSPPEKRGFFGGVVQMGATIGLALATVVLFVCSYFLSQEQFLSWGWRVPFIASVLMLASGLYIRLKVTETPAFQKLREAGEIAKFPLGDVLRHHSKEIYHTAAIYLGAITVPFYTVWVFLIYYGTSVLKVDRSSLLLGVVIVNAVLTLVILAAGSLSDKIGRRPVFFVGFALMIAMAFPFFWVADLAETKWLWLSMVMLAFPLWAAWGALPAFYCELFPERLRYTGISLGSQIATIIGGLVPMFATAALEHFGTWPISALVAVSAILGCWSLMCVSSESAVKKRFASAGGVGSFAK
ncbi:MFS transporter [Achromobacter aegrifaciens]|uniref:Inner membrane metabolite transport protein yhjE n=1 Tax=Achromobacter aegrifaciens TaxID=1287736 RepID=A0AAD2QE71_ACHAE|nr:MFS transporter [Achromobacter aegrifaciens]CUJ68918.1 Inner membrane metabolite transport protein yhjE [Achromobacter aegrifaciens]